MVQAESVSIEENLVIAGSICQCIAGRAYQKDLNALGRLWLCREYSCKCMSV